MNYIRFLNKMTDAFSPRKELIEIRPPALPLNGINLVFCVRNEINRIEYFLEYYRNIGVSQFLVIDNSSDDGTTDILMQQEDCGVWLTKGSYKKSNFGMTWCNKLIERYCIGRWTVCCDPDEFMIYPSCEYRDLIELTNHLEKIGQRSLFCIMIDMYGRGAMKDINLKRAESPITVAPFFDLSTPSQRLSNDYSQFWIQGGARTRASYKNNPKLSPALNKVPLIKWREGEKYISSMHQTNIAQLNYNLYKNNQFVSGALLHFKFVSTLSEKAKEEMNRREHYNSGAEYEMYLSMINSDMYNSNISTMYVNSSCMENLGYISRGSWF